VEFRGGGLIKGNRSGIVKELSYSGRIIEDSMGVLMEFFPYTGTKI